MLPRDEIIAAVDIQKRSYALLLWMSDRLERGEISSHQVEDFSRSVDVALEWGEDNFSLFPEEASPREDQLRPFFAFFRSFLATSFEIEHSPGTFVDGYAGVSVGWEMHGDMHGMKLPYLQGRNPSKGDRRRAKAVCASRIGTLADEEGIDITESKAVADATDHPRSAAYSAYGFSLLERIGGWEGDPYILALWRMLSYDSNGSPIKGFTLEAEDIFDAERELLKAIAGDTV